MALIDEVKKRIPTQKLIELTNPNSRAKGLSTDDVYLQLFVDDVESDFESFGVGIFDITDRRHVAFGIVGVVLKIQVSKLDTDAIDKHEKWQARLEDKLRLVTGNDRILPKSTSQLTPAEEDPTNIGVEPWFDKELVGLDIIPDLRHFGRRSGLGNS